MHVSRVVAVLCGIGLCGAVQVYAQQAAAAPEEESILGLSVSAPGAIGAMYRNSDAVGIRADLSFSHDKTTDNSMNASNGSSTGFTLGGEPIFYMNKYDNVRTYVAPRIAWTHLHTSDTLTTSSSGSPITATTSGSTNGIEFDASFGAEYNANTHWVVFGEAGLAITHASGSLSIPAALLQTGFTPPSPKSNGFGTRAVVGIVFFP